MEMVEIVRPYLKLLAYYTKKYGDAGHIQLMLDLVEASNPDHPFRRICDDTHLEALKKVAI